MSSPAWDTNRNGEGRGMRREIKFGEGGITRDRLFDREASAAVLEIEPGAIDRMRKANLFAPPSHIALVDDRRIELWSGEELAGWLEWLHHEAEVWEADAVCEELRVPRPAKRAAAAR